MAVTEITGHMPVAARRIPPVFWVALAVVGLISLPNLADPMIRHDDFPALFGEGDLFWSKTLHEGRWLNYIWHLRGLQTPAWLNFAAYQLCWATLATALALSATRDTPSTVFASVLAALILVAPPATMISSWFNTLLPGLAVVAAYGLITCRAEQRTARWLLPVFTLPALMAYTTYPLLLLALCLAGTRHRSVADLCAVLILFAASFAAAVAVTYALNWHVHGVFGVPLAPWREAQPATGLPGLWQNLHWIEATFATFLDRMSLGSPQLLLVQAMGFVAALLLMLRRAPLELAYLGAGLLTGIGLIALQAAKLGIEVPPRALLFVWVFWALICLRAAQIFAARPGPLGALGLVLASMVAVAYGVVAHQRYASFHPWLEQTRTLQTALAATSGPVHIFGHPAQSAVGRSAGLQSDEALIFRMRQLGGPALTLCSPPDPICRTLTHHQRDTTGWQVTQVDGRTVVVVPPVDMAPDR
ncbi:hypothetical protein So717_27730 [Roseobacter cerasinus]|uniref:Uncharacterized protein n=1 Tax=Roseobacter cerasinus TaxID=2602289 RepID=A0A640VUD6_9RHOB|nr:hypothetical protein [Roseobacter cerasinus]GFE51020.1 hypothetical protein So717_27730 [Roseobacter cerasinus]